MDVQVHAAGLRFYRCERCGYSSQSDKSNICGGGCSTCRDENRRCGDCSHCMNVLLPLIGTLEIPPPRLILPITQNALTESE